MLPATETCSTGTRQSSSPPATPVPRTCGVCGQDADPLGIPHALHLGHEVCHGSGRQVFGVVVIEHNT